MSNFLKIKFHFFLGVALTLDSDFLFMLVTKCTGVYSKSPQLSSDITVCMIL